MREQKQVSQAKDMLGESYHKDYGEYGAMSNAMSRLGTRITSAITTGRKPIQHIVISCRCYYSADDSPVPGRI